MKMSSGKCRSDPTRSSPNFRALHLTNSCFFVVFNIATAEDLISSRWLVMMGPAAMDLEIDLLPVVSHRS